MNCRQVQKQLRYGYPTSLTARTEIEAHARQCASCRQEIVMERFTSALVKAYADPAEEWDPMGEQRLLHRTMSRIREMKERGTSSWEAAIIGIRGWLFAFGAAALVLLVLSVAQLERSAPTVVIEPRNNDISSVSGLSARDALMLPIDEDFDHAHQ